MNKIILTAACFVLCLSLGAQQAIPVFYGMTSQGGDADKGAIFKTNGNGRNSAVKFSFDAMPQMGKVVLAGNGKLIGVSSYNGGRYDDGILFEYDPLTYTYDKILDFHDTTGGVRLPTTIFAASNGKVYGIYDYSINAFFEYNPVTRTYRIKHWATWGYLDYSDGQLYELDGKLYAGTNRGIFTYDLTTDTCMVGAVSNNFPYWALPASNGKFYYITYQDRIVEYDTATNVTQTVFGAVDTYIANPNYSEGVDFRNELLEYNGKLYGLAENESYNSAFNPQSSVIFEYDLATKTFRKVYALDSANSVEGWYASWAGDIWFRLGSNNKFYGVVRRNTGSTNTYIFEFDPATYAFTKLYTLDFNNQFFVAFFELNGKIYGGDANANAIKLYEYDIATNKLTKLLRKSNNEGNNPYGSLVQASDGKLYGMTYTDATNGNGVLFSFDPVLNSYSKLVQLTDSTGTKPYGALMQAANGKLYGLTSAGGANGFGTLFEFNPADSTLTKKHDFGGYTDAGKTPYGSLIELTSGRLYGMTSAGGFYVSGTVFSYDYLRDTFFHQTDVVLNNHGAEPYGSFVLLNGKLYGLTSTDDGGIIEYNPANNTLTKVATITDNSLNGPLPTGSLTIANGKLYGLTRAGGANNGGMLFSYTPGNTIIDTLFHFAKATGYPRGSLLYASNGKLYGMTRGTLSARLGFIFEFDLTSETLIFTHTFGTGDDGWEPMYGNLIEVLLPGNCSAYYDLRPDANPHEYYVVAGVTGNLPISHIWSWGDGTSDSVPYPTHTYNAAGNYTICLTVTDGEGCIDTYCNQHSVQKTGNEIVTVRVLQQAPVGIADNLLTNISLYPNPTNNTFTIVAPELRTQATLQLHDALGKEVWSIKTQTYELSEGIEVDVQPLPDGIYFLSIRTTQGNRVMKVLKN